MERRGFIKDKESISQPSYLKTEVADGVISFEFSVDIEPKNLDGLRAEIAKDFVEQIDIEIETNMRKGVKK